MHDLKRFCPRLSKKIFIFDCIKCPRFPLIERRRLERCLREFIRCLRRRRPRRRLVDCLRLCLAGLPRIQRRKLIVCILRCLRVRRHRVGIRRILLCANRCMVGLCIPRLKRRRILACLRACLRGFAFRDPKFLLDDFRLARKDFDHDRFTDDFDEFFDRRGKVCGDGVSALGSVDAGEFFAGSEGFEDDDFQNDDFDFDGFDDFDNFDDFDDFGDDLSLCSNKLNEDFLGDVSFDRCGEPVTDCSK